MYLSASGVLDTGDAELIAAAKREYWREYKRAFAQQKRKEHTAFTIYLNQRELKTIREAAKGHKRSATRYIKEASLAYTLQRFVVPDIVLVNDIKQVLQQTYTSIHRLYMDSTIPYALGRLLLVRIEALEQQITTMLEHPKQVSDDS